MTKNIVVYAQQKGVYRAGGSSQFNNTIAQSKSVIDTFAINHWYGMSGDIAISDNGRWVMYDINNLPYQSNTLVVRESYGKRKLEFIGARPGFFTPDDKFFVFMLRDSLRVLTLKTGQQKSIPDVTELTRAGESGSTEWVVYRLAVKPGQLVIHNLVAGIRYQAENVKDFIFAPDGKSILLHQKDAASQSLKLMSLATGKEKEVWSSSLADSLSLDGYLFDKQGAQVAFALSKPEGDRNIWLYSPAMRQAEQKVAFRPAGIASAYKLASDLPSFSGDGRYLYFKVQEPDLPRPKAGFVSLDVWSTTDTVLMSNQLNHLKPDKFACVISTRENAISHELTARWETVEATPDSGDHVVVAYNPSGDRFWLKDNVENYLVSLKDGSRTLLKPNNRTEFHFSPDGKYLVYYDCNEKSKYNSIDVATVAYRDIALNLNADISQTDDFELDVDSNAINGGQFAKWWPSNQMIVYDHYDIWQLDATGSVLPINLTNGYGRRNKIKLRLIEDLDIVVGYNFKSRYNEFYTLNKGGDRNPVKVSSQPYTYFHHPQFEEWGHSFDLGIVPKRSKWGSVYVLEKQANDFAPNVCVTKDFKDFKVLSDIQPQKQYNWLAGSLVPFTLSNGLTTQGVLFKPGDFDSTKKYPVILTYYKQMAQRIYEFPTPGLMENNIEVPWFVSRGYIVFCPDIYYENLHRGRSVLKTALGAYDWLAHQPWVDSSKIGIMGHSVGGYETNYLVTHTNKFAAAIEGAGVSDIISSALQLSGPDSRLRAYEQIMRKSIWQDKAAHLENSPILNVDKVATPILIFHSIKDGAVPWPQAVELFIALRRLSKPSWILQYDNGNHGVFDYKDKLDYTIRVTQFYDHYLKGAPAPDWMKMGIPAKLKGIETRLNIGRW